MFFISIDEFKVLIKYNQTKRGEIARNIFDGFIHNQDSWNSISIKIKLKHPFIVNK